MKAADKSPLSEPMDSSGSSCSLKKEFAAFLEANVQYIEWWYSDTVTRKYFIEYCSGKEYCSGNRGEKEGFYVDFVIRLKSGAIFLFDTKNVAIDDNAALRHNAILKFIESNSCLAQPLAGGVIFRKGSEWLYSPLPIRNPAASQNWLSFHPESS